MASHRLPLCMGSTDGEGVATGATAVVVPVAEVTTPAAIMLIPTAQEMDRTLDTGENGRKGARGNGQGDGDREEAEGGATTTSGLADTRCCRTAMAAITADGGGEGSIGAVVISEGGAEGGGRHTGATIGGVELCTGVVGPGTVHIHPRQL